MNRSSPILSSPILSPDFPGFMVSSYLDISNSRGLYEKTAGASPLVDYLHVKSLPFTREEMLFLESSVTDPQVHLDILMESSGKKRKIKFSVDGVRNDLRPPRAPCNLPLAKITEKKIDYDKLLGLPLAPSSELVDALSWIRSDRLKRHVKSHPLFQESKSRANHHVSRYLAPDMKYLHDTKVFIEKSWGPYTLEIPIFKVPKSDGITSRLIGDARPVNRLLPSQGHMGLPDLPTLILSLLQQRFLYQLDAKSYFYAFSMGEDTADVFGVRWGDRRGHFYTSRWLVMPQGFSYAPRIAQFTSLHISNNTLQGAEDSVVLPWIDNFMFGASDLHQMDSLITRFEHICKVINLDIKPPEARPGVTMDAIGLHFDVSSSDIDEHFVELQTKFKDIMAENEALISSRMTPRQYFQVFGSCMWANYAVARQPLCRWSAALATIRNMAISLHRDGRRESWDETVDVDPVAVRELYDMSKLLRDCRRTMRSLKNISADTDIFTDASQWAWGYLTTAPQLAGEHRMHSIQDIFVAELLAACDAWYTLASEVPNIHVDNTAAVGALLRGHSSTGRGNLILSRLYQFLPIDARAWVTTVPTACQRADLLSRGVYAAGPQCGHIHVSKPAGWLRE